MKNKKIICLVTATMLVGATSITAMAKVMEQEITVSYNDIKVTVNGEKITTNSEPFIYKGTTYLPVRDVAEAVGKDVKWDNNTKTVALTDKEIPYVAPTITEKPFVESAVTLYDNYPYHQDSYFMVDESRIVGNQGFPEDTYAINISNITSSSFDFEIVINDGQSDVVTTVVPLSTAHFVEDGTVAEYYGVDYDLRFTFANDYNALPDVVQIKVEGLEMLDGINFINNGVPGHEFS